MAEQGTLVTRRCLRPGSSNDGRPRSQAMVDNFVGQWLYCATCGGFIQTPIFFRSLMRIFVCFRRETDCLLGTLQADTTLLEMLSADYTYVNQRLAEHYGIPGVYGETF
ncbi:MAG: hypothetical protein Ct9H300mP25_01920 [Acidobacteriota bacterium]|nr:MAG: hypothetical protein Ct9H300mP25_01920 [Acidobacteriota bacterium]